jgi:hypothetical protein
METKVLVKKSTFTTVPTEMGPHENALPKIGFRIHSERQAEGEVTKHYDESRGVL